MIGGERMSPASRPQDCVICEIRDGIARVTLNRPAANAIDLEMARTLVSVALRCDSDPCVRTVLLSGAGNTFSFGGDLKTFAAQGEDLPSYLRELTSYLHLAISRFARLDAPVIAAVQGAAAGGGFGLVCASDIVIAAESARFAMSYTKIGLSPDAGSTYFLFLPRLVGFRRAMELALLNPVLSSRQACEWGIVTQVVADAELASRADEVARTLAAGPIRAFGSTKRLMHSGCTQSLETQMELEGRAIANAAHARDGREGIAAFLEKRPPRFDGVARGRE
jgi:2-(1,2-epoxy-1,2-dihydrophenyl)acetyl-CoA isomerase